MAGKTNPPPPPPPPLPRYLKVWIKNSFKAFGVHKERCLLLSYRLMCNWKWSQFHYRVVLFLAGLIFNSNVSVPNDFKAICLLRHALRKKLHQLHQPRLARVETLVAIKYAQCVYIYFVYFFIEQVLIETIRKYWDRYHLLDILTKVNECMADKQSPNGVNAVHVPYLNHTLRTDMHLGKHENHGWIVKGMSIDKVKGECGIGYFTVVCSFTWPMNASQA